jgi:hypothetical protein
MSSNLFNLRILAATLALAAMAYGVDAPAQVIVPGPNGSVGIGNASGGYDFYYPDRMSLWANIAVPGSHKKISNGVIWKGLDGKIHGDVQDPNTGDIHFYARRPQPAPSTSVPAHVPPRVYSTVPQGRAVSPVQNGLPNYGPRVTYPNSSSGTWTGPLHNSTQRPAMSHQPYNRSR